MGANGRSFARQEPLALRWPFVLLNTPNETPADRNPIEYAADAVEAYLDRDELVRPILLASSFGGAVAGLVALRRPERMGALIMADAVVSRRQIPFAFHGFVDLPQAPESLARMVSPVAVQIMGGFHLDPTAHDEIVREARVFTWLADALGGVFACIHGAGHLPYLTHADKFNARLARFLETFHV